MGTSGTFRQRETFCVEKHTIVDEYGYRWADEKFFGFGDMSRRKDKINLNLPAPKEYLELHGESYPWQNFGCATDMHTPVRQESNACSSYGLEASWSQPPVIRILSDELLDSAFTDE